MTFAGIITALLPEVLVIVAGCVCLFAGLSPARHWRAAVAPITLMALVAAAVATLVGDPHGVFPGLVIGPLTRYVRLVTLAVGALLVLVNWYQSDQQERGEYFAMMLLSMAGVMLVASSNDLLVLLFGLELVSVPTYVLVALSRRDIRAQEACSKYFFLGALAAAITAYGLSFLYGVSGTTTMFGGSDSIAARVASGDYSPQWLLLGLLLTFGGLSFKIAAVPFHGYVGDVYQGAAAPLAALLAFLPKLAGFVGLIKILGLTHWEPHAVLQWCVWAVAVATMTTGNVLALMQTNIKRLLAYSGVAHSGYMLIGLLVGPLAGGEQRGPFYDGLAAVLFYVTVYGLMNLGAFAVLTYLSSTEEEVEEQEQLAGLSRREPLAALALAVCMFSLMGLPPTAGFLGKVYIFSSAFSTSASAGLGQAMIWLAVIGVLNSAIGAAYYLRVVGVCYLRSGTGHLAPRPRLGIHLGFAICAVMMVLLFVWPEPLMVAAGRATHQLGSRSVIEFEQEAGTQPSAQGERTAQLSGASGRVNVNVVP